MPIATVPRRGLSPLWIIAIFLSFCETVLGVAVTRTTGSIQVALTTFVTVFPVMIMISFFIILWKRPYVFYTPADFTKTVSLGAYVEAMHSRDSSNSVSQQAMKNIEGRMATIQAILQAPNDLNQRAEMVLKETVEAIQESVVKIDSRPLLSDQGHVWEEAFEPNKPMSEFLNSLWFEMESSGLPPFTFGQVWALRVVATKSVIRLAGSLWARQKGLEDDERPMSELGLKGGMALEIVGLDGVRREDFARCWPRQLP
jgi:hypothetical protein